MTPLSRRKILLPLLHFSALLALASYYSPVLCGASVTPYASNLTAYLSPSFELYAPPPGVVSAAVLHNSIIPTDAYATVSLSVLNTTHSSLSLTITQSGFQNITSVGIYKSNSDSNAPWPSLLFNISASDNFTSATFVSYVTIVFSDDVYSTPGGFYVQISTAQSPTGAARGQLFDNTTANGVGISNKNVIVANLTGDQVYPTPNPSIFDTAEFSAFVTTNRSSNSTQVVYFQVAVSLFLTNITSVGIYRGRSNSSGSRILNLTPYIRLRSLNANYGFRGAFSANSSTIMEIIANSTSFYAQINSALFPEGVVRAQLQVGSVTPLPPSSPTSLPPPSSPELPTAWPPPSSRDYPPPQLIPSPTHPSSAERILRGWPAWSNMVLVASAVVAWLFV